MNNPNAMKLGSVTSLRTIRTNEAIPSMIAICSADLPPAATSCFPVAFNARITPVATPNKTPPPATGEWATRDDGTEWEIG